MFFDHLGNLGPEPARSRMLANEVSAIASLRTLNSAIVIYSWTDAGYPKTLTDLGPPASGGAASAHGAELFDEGLASGR